MRLNSLRLQNFRQHVDTYVTFDVGLTGIIGANGSGKSTLLEAIAWALYGQDAARGKKETIRSLRAGPNARVKVELDFELGGHRYRVERGLTTAELFLDGSDAPIANSLTGVSELLRRRLGMSRDEFFNTYFTGQKELDVMAAMAPSERAQFLSRVLGYERLRTAQRLVREHGRLLAAEAAGVRAAMPDAASVERMHADSSERLGRANQRARESSERRDGAGAMLADIVPRWLAAQREREQLQEALAELRVAESEAAAYARDAERVERELTEVLSAEAELARLAEELAPIATLSDELQRLDRLASDEGRRRTLLDNERALEDEVRALRERRARIESAPALEEEVTLELEQRRAMLELVEGELEAKRTEWVRDRQEAETKRRALLDQYAEAREHRERLVQAGEDGACPTCERPLHDHYRNVLDHLDEQIDALVTDGKYYKGRLEQLEEDAAGSAGARREPTRRVRRREQAGTPAREGAACRTGARTGHPRSLAEGTALHAGAERARADSRWLRCDAACRRASRAGAAAAARRAGDAPGRAARAAWLRSSRSGRAPRRVSPRHRRALRPCRRGGTCSRSRSRATPSFAAGTTPRPRPFVPRSWTPSQRRAKRPARRPPWGAPIRCGRSCGARVRSSKSSSARSGCMTSSIARTRISAPISTSSSGRR